MVTLTTILASLHRALAWRPGGYLRASGALFGWLAVRTLAQTALFILVARTLGAKGYGELVSVMALAGVFSFAVMGVSAVLVREGARDPLRLPQLVADMVRLWLFYMPVLCVLALGITLLLLDDMVPLSAIVAIVVAEVVCATAVDGIGRIYQSQDRLAMMGLVSSGLMLIRLATFVVLSPFLHWTVTTWAFGYLVGSAGYLGILILMMNRSSLRIKGESIAHTAKASLPFSFSYAAQKIQAEINKPLLARINDVAGAGTLSAAQRFTDLLLLPILAMVETLSPRVYRSERPVATTFFLGVVPLITAALGGVMLIGVAEWVPWILGQSFDAAVPTVIMLAALPTVQVLRWLLGTAMTALELHRNFFVVHGAGALVSVALVAVLVPRHGLPGAVMAAYGTETVLILIQGWILIRSQMVFFPGRCAARRPE